MTQQHEQGGQVVVKVGLSMGVSQEWVWRANVNRFLVPHKNKQSACVREKAAFHLLYIKSQNIKLTEKDK